MAAPTASVKHLQLGKRFLADGFFIRDQRVPRHLDEGLGVWVVREIQIRLGLSPERVQEQDRIFGVGYSWKEPTERRSTVTRSTFTPYCI